MGLFEIIVFSILTSSYPLLQPPLPVRQCIPIVPTSPSSKLEQRETLQAHLSAEKNIRVLQFNVLADGLSGLSPDLGLFSRISFEDLSWDSRKTRLLGEILQYDPDVILLQEVDHCKFFIYTVLLFSGLFLC